MSIKSILPDKWFKGKVILGKGRGKKLGFPTINLSPTDLQTYRPIDLQTFLPHPYGVYLCQVKFGKKIYRGLLHWGPRPTFGETKSFLEIHLLDFNKKIDLGQEVEFKLLKYKRKVKKFKSKKGLINQIKKDLEELFS